MNPKNKESKMNQSNHINENFVNGSAALFSKKIRKYSKLMTSDQSTINTISNLSTENNCNENIENIGEKINNVFEALEKIILNNENENIEEETINVNFSSPSHEEEDKNNLKSKKKSQTIAIPKLDFSDIFDFYQNTPVYIKKIKIRKNKDKHNEKNDEKRKKHHHHKSSHSIKKN